MIDLRQGDCLKLMSTLKDGSIDLILCDLPYGIIKNARLNGWNKETTDWDKRLDHEILFSQYERILRKNGVAILFSQEPYTSELRYKPKVNLKFCYPLIWKKDRFGNALIAKKAPVSYFEDLSVFHKKHDSQLLNPLRDYFQKMLDFIGVSGSKEINKILGHRKAEHCFRINTSQFYLCTEETYNELIKVFKIDKMQGFKTFSDCKMLEKSFENGFTRTFNLPKDKKSVGNVLEFKKEYQRFHPTQKPVNLLKYLINIYN